MGKPVKECVYHGRWVQPYISMGDPEGEPRILYVQCPSCNRKYSSVELERMGLSIAGGTLWLKGASKEVIVTNPKKEAIRPLGDHILVEREEGAGVTPGGIILPETAKDKPKRGKVIAAGPGTWSGETFRKTEVKKDDRVLFGAYAGAEVEFDGKKYLMMPEREVLGVIA